MIITVKKWILPHQMYSLVDYEVYPNTYYWKILQDLNFKYL